ncbi:MAG: thioredoxin domain-containing protein, partial [Actinobacteria bacterium]|nr:thioredoxin domain-containing protein [Actinomycetota bacterium]
MGMANRLAAATSPYLLQHQENPVDWYEWGPAAFEEARRRDVPILLSVGYAACHWCHVMAHESFEDPETAQLMNEKFVNVKVDREERPDVDSIYMEAVQTMTGHGGWPMTVWLDHQGRPFFAGTYFPDRPRHGMASFRQVIEAVSDAWEQRRSEVEGQAENLLASISRTIPPRPTGGEETLESAFQAIASSFDARHGGFGGPPKFPQQPVLEWLLRVREEEWAAGADAMVVKTLDEMAAGGIHDQIGGGFARYSVDEHWLVPHFEKMLYDNAQLARVYLWAGVELKREDFAEVARRTLDYVLRDLRHPDGGLFSSEDADSEGVEGKFYVWSRAEIEEVLGEGAEEIIGYYGVTEGGNFEGANILNVVGDEPPPGLDPAREALLEARGERVRPGLDDKVVASWNGLGVRALAEAGAALSDDRYLEAARQTADFVLLHLVEGGRLMRSWREGRTSVPGFLDDHASMAVALFSLYAATGEERWYEEATAMVDRLDRFANPEGGYYTTAEDGETLVKRPVDYTDNPLPSGNGLAAEAHLLAALYTGEARHREQTEQALRAAGLLMERYPSMVGRHLAVLHSSLHSRELAVVGPEWRALASVYWERFRPEIALAGSAGNGAVVPLLRDRHQPGRTLAYLCHGFV